MSTNTFEMCIRSVRMKQCAVCQLCLTLIRNYFTQCERGEIERVVRKQYFGLQICICMYRILALPQSRPPTSELVLVVLRLKLRSANRFRYVLTVESGSPVASN